MKGSAYDIPGFLRAEEFAGEADDEDGDDEYSAEGFGYGNEPGHPHGSEVAVTYSGDRDDAQIERLEKIRFKDDAVFYNVPLRIQNGGCKYHE